ncbi:MAG: DUF1684 domain-containing protein [Flavobacteriales bacterium]
MRLLRCGWLFGVVVAGHMACAQDATFSRDSLDAYWARMDAEFADSAQSPLKSEDRAHFEHLERFAPDRTYRVEAVFKQVQKAEPFAMKTSTARLPQYKVHGTLTFTLGGQEFTLPVYESATPDPNYPGYLFLPFTDLTNGEETYGGGRYLDLQAPLGPVVVVDFNKAYNPYCAYSDRYSCPIPPIENHVDAQVRAGVLKFHE